MSAGVRSLLVVNPSPDQYGADLQMVQAVVAAVEHGWQVTVVLPEDGPLVDRVRRAGAEVTFASYPVLRKANLRPRSLLAMLREAAATLPSCVRLVRRSGADLVLVNTATLPWWLLAARLARRPVVGYLHEAETAGSRRIRAALVLPFGLAQQIIVISRSAMTAMTEVAPWLARRAVLVYNGVPIPDEVAPAEPLNAQGVRLAVVGRLSPRKGTDVALRAVARLRRQGVDARLEVAGTTFSGYEWFEEQLRELASGPDLAGAVEFSGYCSPVWPVLERAQVVLAPSLNEPFGNAVVEAQLAERVVVAAASQGHLESIDDGDSGVLVTPGDDAAMAEAVARLLSDPQLAQDVAAHARAEARRRFSVFRYRAEVGSVLDAAHGR